MFWGQGWPGGLTTTAVHYNASNYTDHAPGYHIHFWDEGRALKCNWRGYLLAGKYAPYKVLGCSAKDYRGETWNVGFRCSYNGEPSNFFTGHPGATDSYPDETNAAADSFRHRPAFVWYGPPGYNTDNLSEYAGANIDGPVGNYKKPRSPLTSACTSSTSRCT
jgi:hypothetical protein